MPKNCVNAITMTSLNATTLAGDYAPINPSGLTEPCALVRLINNTNRDLLVSYDGVTPHDFVRNGSTIELNLQTNSQPNNKVAKLARGMVVYVNAAAGTGFVYLVGYYQPNY